MTLHPIKRLEASHSYGLLLGVIVTALVFQASAPDVRWARLVVVALQAILLLLALWVSRTPERDFRFGLIGSGIAFAAAAVMAFNNQQGVNRGGVLLVGAAVVLVVPLVIAHGVYHLIRTSGVTLQAVYGVLCIYLLLGMIFAFAFGAVAALQGGALFTNGTDGDLQDHLYFSFITITTVGYGDLAPSGHLARGLAILEALAGQLYLVTVVAVIVGNLRRQRAN